MIAHKKGGSTLGDVIPTLDTHAIKGVGEEPKHESDQRVRNDPDSHDGGHQSGCGSDQENRGGGKAELSLQQPEGPRCREDADGCEPRFRGNHRALVLGIRPVLNDRVQWHHKETSRHTEERQKTTNLHRRKPRDTEKPRTKSETHGAQRNETILDFPPRQVSSKCTADTDSHR